MLFMSIYSFEGDKAAEVVKRRKEGLFLPEGIKCLGQWSSAGGGRVYTVIEADDLMALALWSRVWSDLGKGEVIPIVDTQELIQTMGAKK